MKNKNKQSECVTIEECLVYVFDSPAFQVKNAADIFDDNGGDPDGNAYITDDIGDEKTKVKQQKGWRINNYNRNYTDECSADGKWCGFLFRGEAFALDKDDAIAIARDSVKANRKCTHNSDMFVECINLN